ncbi:transport protein Avl9-domain-containing protein [Polychytrium aggregatum]|uniref:transport protein Avl9-domain-containing protein n=1 Tax=Polychytrium aggregatum TaxID=110093 RepID=UPI0022FE82B7|nr:transport protein Avl9-domain-containing protein [Polychytrium aggregatum]KAI9193197.1 transport protein Avl9-domain-containing protein [Polychytrium aggregatum]
MARSTRVRSPSSSSNTSDSRPAIDLPEEWSFLPFLCLPDGAHASEEEFIYFHLPPVPQWTDYPQSTIFGLACFRQIPTSELVHKTSDLTRSTVQKAVVVLAREPVLGFVRTKLGLVTQAFFAQKDFSQLEILDNLFDNMRASVHGYVNDATLYAGISLRELVFTFKYKALQLLKLLLLEKRILFFGQRVEKLSSYQYSLVSLIPDLLRHLDDVGSPLLGNAPDAGHHVDSKPSALTKKLTELEDLHLAKLKNFGLPLRVFGKGCFFQPYIPLQQIDVLMSPETKSFLVGTSNAIFTHHKACAIHAVVNVDTGNIEITDPALNAALALTPPDRRFIDEIAKSVTNTWNTEDPASGNTIEFGGSDDDLRARFELYLQTLCVSMRASLEPNSSLSVSPTGGANKAPPKDYISDYNINFIRMWQTTTNYKLWESQTSKDMVDAMSPGHPFQGTTSLTSVQQSLAARWTELGKAVTPLQQSVGRALSTAEMSISKAVSSVVAEASSTATANTPQSGTGAATSTSTAAAGTGAGASGNFQARATSQATQMFNSVSSWYSQKRKEWIATTQAASDHDLGELEGDGAFEVVPLHNEPGHPGN